VKVLLTGGAGQLGREVARAFAGAGEVTALDRSRLDVTCLGTVRQAFLALRPDVVVHLAALTDVDRCEAEPELAFRVNALGSRHVALAAAAVGARLVHVSTDYVFSGEKGAPYHEFDAPDPIQVYGASKLAGEREVGAHHPRAFVVRTAWLYGHDAGRNFVAAVRRSAAGRKALAVVADQWGSPTYARDLALALPGLVASEAYGTYHLAGGGETSRAEWARRIVGRFCPEVGVVEVPTARPEPGRAARPRRSSLVSLALAAAGLPELPPWEDAFERFAAAERER
jgi:dTDP-4-dehydrorhamnose reductase